MVTHQPKSKRFLKKKLQPNKEFDTSAAQLVITIMVVMTIMAVINLVVASSI